MRREVVLLFVSARTRARPRPGASLVVGLLLIARAVVLAGAGVLAWTVLRLSVILLAGTVGFTLSLVVLLLGSLLGLLLVSLVMVFSLLLLLLFGLVQFLGRVVDLTSVTVLAGSPPVNHRRPVGLAGILLVQSRI